MYNIVTRILQNDIVFRSILLYSTAYIIINSIVINCVKVYYIVSLCILLLYILSYSIIIGSTVLCLV